MQAINWILRLVGLIFLILFQVLVLNKLNVSTYIHPYVYPMFITAGMHAAACVFIAFARPWLIKRYTPITGYENVNAPSLSELGVVWFALFTLTVIFIHHSIYYFLQVFWMNDVGYLLLKIFLSTLVSTLLIVIFAFLFAKRKVKR